MEGAGPGQATGRQGLRSAARRRCPDDRLDASRHLLCGSPGEGQQQHPLGADALHQQMRDAVRQRHGLAGAGAGNDEQGTGTNAATLLSVAVLGRKPLRRIQDGHWIDLLQSLLHGCLSKVCIFIQYWMHLQGLQQKFLDRPGKRTRHLEMQHMAGAVDDHGAGARAHRRLRREREVLAKTGCCRQ